MKLLLDENLPKRLKQDLTHHDVATVRDKGWAGIINGKLLQLLIEEQFNVLVTFDKNLRHQQNFDKYPITMIVLVAVDNRYSTLAALVPELKAILGGPFKTGVLLLTNKN
jgi:hypothetical protein